MSRFPELIAFDLDGTLLRSDGSLSPRVRQAVREIKNRGCVIVLSTGRPWRAVAKTVERLGVVDYCVCLNGASLHKPDGQLLKLTAMTEQQTRESAQLARRLSRLRKLRKLETLWSGKKLSSWLFLSLAVGRVRSTRFVAARSTTLTWRRRTSSPPSASPAS